MSSVLKSSIFVSLLTLLASLISFVNQMVIASNFGTGIEMDNYLFLTSFPFLLSGVISSALSFSLIPHLVTKSFDYFRKFLQIASIISVIIFFLFWACYHFYVIDFFHLEDFKNITVLNLIIWLVFLFTIIFNIILCYFTSKSMFLTPVVLNFSPFVFSIFSILIFNRFGVISIIIGLLVGYIFAIIYSLLYLEKSEGGNKEVSDYKKEIFIFIKSMKFSILSMITFSIFQIIDAYWGKKLGVSSISYLGYSQRIIIALGALVISGPSTVLMPKLTEAYKKGNLENYYEDSSMIIKLVFALTSFAALLFAFFSTDIVRLMFERGNFTAESTMNVAELLRYMLVGMVFMLCVVISFRALFVQPITYKTGVLGIITGVVYFILSGIFSKYFQIQGIAFAYILTWGIIFNLSLYLLFKTNYLSIIKDFYFFFIKQIISLSVVFLIMSLFKIYFIKNTSIYIIELLKIVLICIVSSLVYTFITAKILKMKEINLLLGKLPFFRK